MFQLFKKRKDQEVENVEKNENIEKNENSSVDSENISENSASIFPSANETLEVSKQKWKQVTAEEILEKVNYESSRGNRYAKFFDAYISEELVKELSTKGYTVKVHSSPALIGPYFDISW